MIFPKADQTFFSHLRDKNVAAASAIKKFTKFSQKLLALSIDEC